MKKDKPKRRLLLAQIEALKEELRQSRLDALDRERQLSYLTSRLGARCSALRQVTDKLGLQPDDWGRLGAALADLRPPDQIALDEEALRDQIETARLHAKRLQSELLNAKDLVKERTRQRDLAAGDYVALHDQHLELKAQLEEDQKRRAALLAENTQGQDDLDVLARAMDAMAESKSAMELDLEVLRKRLANAEGGRARAVNKRIQTERAAGRFCVMGAVVWLCLSLLWLYAACTL